VIRAAKAAGVHEMILRLPEGYQTELGPNGASLSAGQRQRIGLARALYGEPFLVMLDEPNANLDSEGEKAVAAAIAGVKARGGIAVVIAHRPSALKSVDLVAVVQNGKLASFGPRDEILRARPAESATSVRQAAAPAHPAPAAAMATANPGGNIAGTPEALRGLMSGQEPAAPKAEPTAQAGAIKKAAM